MSLDLLNLLLVLLAALAGGALARRVGLLLEELGGELLFGRQVNLEGWDIAVAEHDVVDLTYEVADPEDVVHRASTTSNPYPEMASLSLVVLSEDDCDVFSSQREVSTYERVVGVGRVVRPHEPAGDDTKHASPVGDAAPLGWIRRL